MSSDKIILVTGASRGIGLELVRQLGSAANTTVFAAMRKPVAISAENENIKVIQLDQTSAESVADATSKVPELDTLILNAAMGEDDHLLDLTPGRLTQYLDPNVVGPNRVVQAFLPALLARKTRQIVYISSSAGSLQGQVGESWGLQGPYSVTKAAGNMMVIQWQNELADRAFTVVTVHPGWVDTDMGRLGGNGGMRTEESARKLIELVDNLTLKDGSRFFNYNKMTMPW